ncbi:hypothetical protein BpHYR1_026600 [Brachionus plicatilis]|uniref:Uncharacterized protein n=1 Tax=Brachionus plicatilis TaxID=10195 RepID=A0A3M7P5U2_BRAPC|nr:hypothetical protein BpHYR1_026600 [Brachionus plicatilis]
MFTAIGTHHPAPRLADWIIRLISFDFKILYRKGTKQKNADSLSRWPLKSDDNVKKPDNDDLMINMLYENEVEQINTIHFQEINKPKCQKSDTDIAWFIEILRNNKEKP